MPDDSAPRTKYFSPASVERTDVAIDRRDHIERKAHQLEAEIERDQVGRRDQHHHAGGREQDQDRIFELLLLLDREIIDRHQDRDRRAGQRQQLEEAGEAVDHEAAAEGDELVAGQPPHDGPSDDQQQDRRASRCRASPARRGTRRPSAAPWRRRRARSPAGPAAARELQGFRSSRELRDQCASRAAVFAAPSAWW